MATRASVYRGPFRVVVYHNMGTWEQEWNYGDGDLAFEVDQETVVIGIRVLYPNGDLFSAVHYGLGIAKEAAKVNVNMAEMTKAIERNLEHDELIGEDLDEPNGHSEEGKRVGDGDPDEVGDQSEENPGQQSDD